MRRSRRRPCTSALLAVALVAAPAPVAAGRADAVAAYREAVARGQARFDDGDYAGARAEFQAAFEIHADPVLLFNIASTHRREGDLERAIELYRAFLDRAERDDPRRSLATQTVVDLEAELAARVDAEREVELERDPAPPPAPPPEPEPEPAREPEPVLERDAPPPPAPRPGRALRYAGLGTAGAGVVAAGLALVAVRDVGRAERAVEALAPGDSWSLDAEAAYARGVAAERRAILWTAAGAALVTTGVVLYVVGKRRDDAAEAAVTVTPSGDGAAVTLFGRF